jgi:ankyrin repeat protein
VINNNIDAVSYLLSSGKVKTGLRDLDGRTCLHYAVFNTQNEAKAINAYKIIKSLIEVNPALPNIKDYYKKGPGNPEYAVRTNIREYIKSRKSTLFRKNPNTNKNKGVRHTRRG